MHPKGRDEAIQSTATDEAQRSTSAPVQTVASWHSVSSSQHPASGDAICNMAFLRSSMHPTCTTQPHVVALCPSYSRHTPPTRARKPHVRERHVGAPHARSRDTSWLLTLKWEVFTWQLHGIRFCHSMWFEFVAVSHR